MSLWASISAIPPPQDLSPNMRRPWVPRIRMPIPDHSSSTLLEIVELKENSDHIHCGAREDYCRVSLR